MNNKDKEFESGFIIGAISSAFIFGILLLYFIYFNKSILEKFKREAVNYHHAEYVINNNGQIEFRWKKLLEY
jgi:hypothetical protein